MAAKDPDEKSLFSRIKDCVLMELGRKANEPLEKAPCLSRSMWGWKIDKNYVDTEVEPPAEPRFDKSKREKLGDQAAAAAAAAADRGGDEGDQNEDVRKKLDAAVSQEEKKIEKNNGNKIRVDGDETLKKSDSGKNGRDGDKITSDDVERDKLPAEQQDDSHCAWNKYKPVRYYIKMQDPEAPICCESVRPARKICPPKMRKPQKESSTPHDGYTRSACQCDGVGACSSSS